MPAKVINYEDWQSDRSLVEARAKRILSFFDLPVLKRKPRDPERQSWLEEHGQSSKFENADPPDRSR